MKKYISDEIWTANVPFVPHTKEETAEMLKFIGVSDIEDLLAGIPDQARMKQPLDLQSGMSELEAMSEMKRLAGMNRVMTCFAGGGVYDHFQPSALDAVISRPEFYTAYTPYQPEVSQGTLQAIFEYQSLICNLTGMDISNASLYCGGTALTEAAILAVRHTGRKKILIGDNVHPHHIQILRTYGASFPFEIITIPADSGTLDTERVKAMLDDRTAGVIVQHPNFYGLLEETNELGEVIHSNGSLFIASFDPISLGILQSPGEYGADVAVAEGQSLGNSLNYGGPYLGIIAVNQKYVRSLPGRIAGETVDLEGKRGYVLTLQTREQHIRREKATSNICTNQALCALTAAAFLCFMGKSGIKEMAEQSLQKAHYLANEILKYTDFKLKYPDKPFFKEFLVTSHHRAKKVVDTLAKKHLLIGPSLGRFHPVVDEHSFLIAVTESRTKNEMEWVIDELKQVSSAK